MLPNLINKIPKKESMKIKITGKIKTFFENKSKTKRDIKYAFPTEETL